MELVHYKINAPSRADIVNLVWMGDSHIGHRNSDRKLFEKQIQWVKDNPNAHLVVNGDIFDLVLGRDKRVDPDQVDPYFIDDGADIPDAQLEYATETLLPVKDRIVGIHTGNHEETWKVIHYNNVIRKLCKNLSVPYLSYTAFIRFHFDRGGNDRKVLICRSSHGTGAARTKGAILNQLHNLQKSFIADIYAQGHAHRRVLDVATILSIPEKQIRRIDQVNRAFVATGSFFQTYKLGGESSYGEKKDYPPGDLGGAYVKIEPWGEGILDACPLLP